MYVGGIFSRLFMGDIILGMVQCPSTGTMLEGGMGGGEGRGRETFKRISTEAKT